MTTLEEQQQVSNEIYAKLRVIDPYCLLAGGAPRDWYFGNPANDLDFYFSSVGKTVSAVLGQLEAQFGKGAVCLLGNGERDESLNEIYKTMPGLVRIWEMEYKNQKVQLIQVVPSFTFKVVDHMDVSICQVWWMNNKIHIHENFKLTLASKIMFTTHPDYKWGDRHGRKMVERFGGKFLAGTKDQAIRKILRNMPIELP